MIANALFYTFSTIAQTLAGAIALLGAFVLYRLQSLRQAIERDSQSIVGRYDSYEGYDPSHQQAARALHDQQRYREILAFFESTPQQPSVDQATRERAQLRIHIDQKDSLSKAFRVSLYLTVALILLSVFALAAAPTILASGILTTVLFIIGVSAFIACIVSYVFLIQKALQ